MSHNELLIRCPGCSKLLKIAAATTPSKIQCPSCNKTLQIQATSPESTSQPSSAPATPTSQQTRPLHPTTTRRNSTTKSKAPPANQPTNKPANKPAAPSGSFQSPSSDYWSSQATPQASINTKLLLKRISIGLFLCLLISGAAIGGWVAVRFAREFVGDSSVAGQPNQAREDELTKLITKQLALNSSNSSPVLEDLERIESLYVSTVFSMATSESWKVMEDAQLLVLATMDHADLQDIGWRLAKKCTLARLKYNHEPNKFLDAGIELLNALLLTEKVELEQKLILAFEQEKIPQCQEILNRVESKQEEEKHLGLSSRVAWNFALLAKVASRKRNGMGFANHLMRLHHDIEGRTSKVFFALNPHIAPRHLAASSMPGIQLRNESEIPRMPKMSPKSSDSTKAATDSSIWTITVSAYFHTDVPVRLKEKFIEEGWAFTPAGFNSSGSSNANMGPSYPFSDLNQKSHQPTSYTVKTPLDEQDIIRRLEPWHVFAVDASTKTIRVVVTDKLAEGA